MFRAMPNFHVVPGAQRDAKVRWRAAAALRRSAVVAGAVGLTAAAGLLSAGSALASAGSEPGNLILKPASGATTLRPTFATTTGCPTGYQASAQVSAFHANGTFGSRISYVVSNGLTHPFSGLLDFKMNLLLRFGSRVAKGQGSEWAVGCYSGIGGTGRVSWVQSTFVTLSSTGTSYSTSKPAGSGSSTGGGQTTTTGGSATAGSAATGGNAKSLNATNSSNTAQIAAASIAGACGLAVALGGIAWQRRRNRGRVQ